MPKRQIRKRRADDDDEEEAATDNDLLEVLEDASLPIARGGRDRKHGISILDAGKDSGHQEQQRGQASDNKAASDVLSQRMEEYVGSELDKTFQPSHQKPADGELTQYSIREDDEAVPSHLETKPVQEVSVPGFNKAITKVALTKDASGTIPTEVVTMAKTKRSAPDGGLGRRNQGPWVDRTLFPSRFGKQRKT